MQIDHRRRIERLEDGMEELGLAAALFPAGPDLLYLSGYEASDSERVTMLVVVPGERPTLVVPQLEAPRVESDWPSVLAWTETEDPLAKVAGLVRGGSRAAIGDHARSSFLLGLQQLLPDVRWTSGSELTAPLRRVKDGAEVEALRDAATRADEVARGIPDEVRFAGSGEREVARAVSGLLVEAGHDTAEFVIVASGPNGASPHHEAGNRVIEDGDLVVLDFGGKLSHYCSDTTRTFSVGEPSDRQAEIHGVVWEAQRSARQAARPGARACDVDAAARDVIEDAGLGEYFVHRTGHGIGIEVHEHPYIVAGNELTLEPGMAFSIEPGVYLPGELGVRIEDICVVTVEGLDALNDSDRSLVVVG